jgi:isopenicillin N synthase-like dioxygenase
MGNVSIVRLSLQSTRGIKPMSDVKMPDVRGEMKDDPETLYLMDHPDSTEEIPMLDMGPYLAGEPGGREKVAARLREISQTVGFFYVKNHGIAQEIVDGVFAQSRRFHTLPAEEKAKIPYFTTDTFKSGYQPGQEERPQANVNIIPDAKPNLYARFSINREGGSGGLTAPPPSGPVNIWPENLPGFREVVEDYQARIENLGRQFLPLWATSLGLPLEYFDKYFVQPHLTLSLLHYPPQKEIGNRQYGIAPHTDNSLMTILAQADVSGLAVRMPSGHWRMVETIPGSLLINTGNLMVRWTNGEYLSTKHRVINTNTVDRYSIPVFFGPSGDAVIEAVPTCQGPERPVQYEPITYRNLRQWYYGAYS